MHVYILDNKKGVDFGFKNKDGELKIELVIFTDGRSDLWHSRMNGGMNIYNKQLDFDVNRMLPEF